MGDVKMWLGCCCCLGSTHVFHALLLMSPFSLSRSAGLRAPSPSFTPNNQASHWPPTNNNNKEPPHLHQQDSPFSPSPCSTSWW